MNRLAVSALLLWTAAAGATDVPPPGGSHGRLACSGCHRESGLQDCGSCHEAAPVPHPIGVKPSMEVPARFVLGTAGELLCRSCHRLHGGDPATSYLVDGTEPCAPSVRGFCATCHRKGLDAVNPHRAKQGPARCAACHLAPAGTAEADPARLRSPPDRLCDFCHGARSRGHPQDTNPRLPLPPELAVAEDGSPLCTTCHAPHGTALTTQHLRPAFARHYGRGQEESPHIESYFACPGCHTTSFPDEIRPPDFRLLYQGDVSLLCLSCHPVVRGHHPTGIRLPQAMASRREASPLVVPLDAKGRITCNTCHDNGCRTGRQGMRNRHYDAGEARNDLCWICHTREDLAANNPHGDDPALCRWCHESLPTPGPDGRQSLMAGPTLVCLQCHERRAHPATAEHLVAPSQRIRVDRALPMDERGMISCVTCHDPHLTAVPLPQRLRFKQAQLCSHCHDGARAP